MGLYHRRRPSPIQIFPTRVRRQDATASQSPKSPESSAPSQVSSQAATTEAPQSTAAPATPPPPPTPSSSSAQEQPRPSSSSSATRQPQQSSTPAVPTSVESSTAKESTSTSDERTSSSGIASSVPVALPVFSSSPTSTSQSTALPSPTGGSSFVSRRPASSPPSQTGSSSALSDFEPSTTRSTFVPAQSELDGEREGLGRHRTEHQEGPIISKGAEAAAITLSILGFIALIAGLVWFLRHRRRRRNESSMRHAEDAFNPGNSGSLHAPETAHIDYDGPPPSLAHMTKSSTSSTELFAGAHYERPETVSTKSNNSRIRAAPSIAPPQPTPNPFADPPRNKAYDQLRGRPRSTTLTDRGSWVGNPFKDPASERFDPFGELQEKARAERRKYVEEARREAEDRRRREDEQDYLEKERAGLSVPKRDERKGSDVTVGGMGVLDRSGDGRWS
ncbi:uncharacterized protein CC84DRAFT_1190388 [Paraphaeosphaeria sporulosa]|uniref:Uncharacterized protein n=1 Tax=Paraphaeosphaeria sporulosa TaxID=1460663 RepID=A0A177C0E5_9PLEO|nr:uncharacterized protein CC84DRAFT_1190388 [Paraphaeosphaeria sporulosa]OAG01264.1 hypothetical protein CC84DRAFT_1190388 [Paraphaeosphaeria sporulosa]